MDGTHTGRNSNETTGENHFYQYSGKYAAGGSSAQTQQVPTAQREVPEQTKPSSQDVFANLGVTRNGVAADGDDICKNGTRSQRKYVEASEYDEWVCPNCGKVNQEYVGMCACGTGKPSARKR